MKIRISIADKVVIASVADNATARDFVSVLPLSVSMKDLFGREKYGDLPEDANSFFRAFHHWEGTSPGQWRLVQKNGQPATQTQAGAT